MHSTALYVSLSPCTAPFRTTTLLLPRYQYYHVHYYHCRCYSLDCKQPAQRRACSLHDGQHHFIQSALLLHQQPGAHPQARNLLQQQLQTVRYAHFFEARVVFA
jgi:hypothetical protein